MRLRLSCRIGGRDRPWRSCGLRRNGLGPLTLGRGVIRVVLVGSVTSCMMEFSDLLQVATNVGSRATLQGIVDSRLQLLASYFVTIVIRWAI